MLTKNNDAYFQTDDGAAMVALNPSMLDDDGSQLEEEVHTTAVETTGCSKIARSWMSAPHPDLGGKSPRSVVATPVGRRKVLRMLGAIANGYEA